MQKDAGTVMALPGIKQTPDFTFLGVKSGIEFANP